MSITRLYDLFSKDIARAIAAANARTLHIWHLEDAPHVPSGCLIARFGVVSDHSSYVAEFLRLPDGRLFGGCTCESGWFRNPCYHVGGSLNFFLWREEIGLGAKVSSEVRGSRWSEDFARVAPRVGAARDT